MVVGETILDEKKQTLEHVYCKKPLKALLTCGTFDPDIERRIRLQGPIGILLYLLNHGLEMSCGVLNHALQMSITRRTSARTASTKGVAVRIFVKTYLARGVVGWIWNWKVCHDDNGLVLCILL